MTLKFEEGTPAPFNPSLKGQHAVGVGVSKDAPLIVLELGTVFCGAVVEPCWLVLFVKVEDLVVDAEKGGEDDPARAFRAGARIGSGPVGEKAEDEEFVFVFCGLSDAQ